MPNDTKVQGEPIVEVAGTPVTPDAGVTETTVTPETRPSDAGKLAEIEVVKAKYEKDLSAMKSSLQRNESQLRQEFASKQEQFEQELENLKVSNMDEDQRKQYEAGSSVRKLQQMEQKLYEVENEKIEKEAMLKAQNYFLQQGVPASVLNVDEGYDTMWNAGMEHLINELKTLRQTSSLKSTSTPIPPITAPVVVTQSNTPANTGTNWNDLVKTYGTEEAVYRLVETGQLDVSVIPVSK